MPTVWERQDQIISQMGREAQREIDNVVIGQSHVANSTRVQDWRRERAAGDDGATFLHGRTSGDLAKIEAAKIKAALEKAKRLEALVASPKQLVAGFWKTIGQVETLEDLKEVTEPVVIEDTDLGLKLEFSRRNARMKYTLSNAEGVLLTGSWQCISSHRKVVKRGEDPAKIDVYNAKWHKEALKFIASIYKSSTAPADIWTV